MAQELNLIILEDAPYTYIRYEDHGQLPFFARDPDGRVVHLFTASKIKDPGDRVAFAHVPTTIKNILDHRIGLGKIVAGKSASGMLMHSPAALRRFRAFLHGPTFKLGSLWPEARRKAQIYRENRDILLAGLEHYFGDDDRISWTKPDAGFFVPLTVTGCPIPLDGAFVADKLIRTHGVTAIPMSGFYAQDVKDENPMVGMDQLRLSFSYTREKGEDRRRAMERAVERFGTGMRQELGLTRIP
jgi:DNA-binding transcriptional MocR family regulator